MKKGTRQSGTRLRIVLEPDIDLAGGKADILEGIRDTGSIAAAGRRMGMSYKRAWLLVNTLNRCFSSPLVETTRGDQARGGAVLTRENISMSPTRTRRFIHHYFALIAVTLWLPLHGPSAQALAAETLIAVAANFTEAADALKPEFERASGHRLVVTTGSTGKLYAQIVAGAPFQVFLSADAKTPARLEEEQLAVAGTRFTYAVGKLTLWSADSGRITADGQEALTDPGLRFVAIANPQLAPYGVAAREALQSMGLWEQLQPRIVMGENIGQTHSMVVSGAAELGFVALSAVLSPRAAAGGSRWDVPQQMFTALRQEAILLIPGKDNPAATTFLEFLKTNAARAVIQTFGYTVD